MTIYKKVYLFILHVHRHYTLLEVKCAELGAIFRHVLCVNNTSVHTNEHGMKIQVRQLDTCLVKSKNLIQLYFQ